MPPVGFEFTSLANERSKTHALDRAATGIGIFLLIYLTLVGTVQLKAAIFTICKCGVNGNHLHLRGMRDQIHGYRLNTPSCHEGHITSDVTKNELMKGG
jgi:hypothetical protein